MDEIIMKGSPTQVEIEAVTILTIGVYLYEAYEEKGILGLIAKAISLRAENALRKINNENSFMEAYEIIERQPGF